LDRRPFSTPAAQLFSKVESEEVSGYLCATTVTTVHYLACKAVGVKKALTGIKQLLTLFSVASVNRAILEAALTSRFKDYEDAVFHEAALQAMTNGIVTCNTGDFKFAKIPVYLPEELLQILHSH